VRTNDAVLVSAIEALLDAAQIPHLLLDQNMSVLEGSLGILPRRILVQDEHKDSARRLLEDAGHAHELRPRSDRQTLEFTDDAVLGGRMRVVQSRTGHRVGHDAILLATATPARSGDRVIELGAGVGAAGLAVAAWLLHSAGTLTMIWRADGLARVLAALEPHFGEIVILPVHGRAGEPAIRILMRAKKGSRAPLTLSPALFLNDAAGRPMAEAESVLRGARPLPMGENQDPVWITSARP